jgi:hypothetical protein
MEGNAMVIENVMKISFFKVERKKAEETVKALIGQGHVQIGDTGYSKEGARVITLTGKVTG